MNDTPHTPAPGAPLGAPPRGAMTMADVAYRRNALEHAVRFVGSGRPSDVVAAAAAFEAYLRDGAARQPAPGPLLPPDLVQVLLPSHASSLYVVQLVLAERLRQIGKGWTPGHDDEHADGRIGYEAAAAIMSPGSRLDQPLTASYRGGPWIAEDLSRTDQLVQGIALAVAELERVHRANDRENLAAAAEYRTHGADSAVDDELPEEVDARPIRSIGPDDWDDMHHALGRPRDPMLETHRNHFATNEGAPEAERFRELDGYWIVRETPASGEGHLTARLTDRGRAALAEAMRHNPALFPDIRIENGPSAMPPADGDGI